MPLSGAVSVEADGDAVAFELTATNEGDGPVELTFGSGQTAEFVVEADGESVWRWSDERLFTQRVRRERLGPGEAVAAEAEWSDPRPGRYTVAATLVATDHRPTASATFEV